MARRVTLAHAARAAAGAPTVKVEAIVVEGG
jgi:hypothetical protein